MIPGYALLALALLSTISASVLYLMSAKRDSALSVRHHKADKAPDLVVWARRLVYLGAIAVFGAAVTLDILIATHQFQFAYVAEYSAKRSSAPFLFAAFWGGQEGSILLWTFWTTMLGVVLARRSGGVEAKIWPIFSFVQMFLLTLVLVKCPFRLGTGPVPDDGTGLNPLLENVWMVIHPPILFLGFSSLSVPWAWSMYGMIYKDWDGWLARVGSWALFSFTVLGFGVALGGYWAYETLGWGGFWGWDPVECSSLIPWPFVITLLHGIMIQRRNGGFKVGNLMLASLPFGFMCYGTFLTRTGLLADFSVHSFSSLGKDGFVLLLGMVICAFAFPVLMMLFRWKGIPKPAAYAGVLTREFGLFMATSLMGVLGILTAAGMSAPLITKLWITKGAAAPPEYYNSFALPLAIALLLSLAVTPYVHWRASTTQKLGLKLLPAYVIAVMATLTIFALGAHKPLMLLLFACAIFAISASALLMPRLVARPGGRRTVGGLVAHIGAAMLLVGIACLISFSQQALHVTLVKDVPINVLGYNLTYLGESLQPYDVTRSNVLRIKVEKDGNSYIATPHLYLTPWGGQDQLFANPPDIHNFAWGDLYLAHYKGPYSAYQMSPSNGVDMSSGDTFTFGEYTFTCLGMKWSDAVMKAMMSGGEDAVAQLPEMRVHTNMLVNYRGQSYRIQPEYVEDQLHQTDYSVAAQLPGPPNAVLVMNDFKPPSSGTFTTFNLPDPLETVQMDLSTKPMIWLVWMGTVIYTIGGFIAFRRRALVYGTVEPEVAYPEPNPQPVSTTPPITEGPQAGLNSPA